MHYRRQFAGFIVLLGVLGMLIGLNSPRALMAHGSLTPGHRPAKDNLQILPKKLKAPLGVPANTISLYESTTNNVTMYNQGCSAAHGAPGLIILDWGQPVYFGNNIYGTYDFGGHDDTDTAILHAVANFAQGAWYCRTRSTNIALAIGESNYYSDHAIPLTTWAWYADGQQWGNMVNNLQSFIDANHYNVVGANAAGDLEVEWNSFSLTSSLVNGYNSVTRHIYFDFGDDSPGWWTNYQVWYIAYGATDNLPLPEIFYNADAVYDWEPLDVWACSYEGGPMYFKGTIAENAPGTNSPYQAFTDMYNAEASNSCTARDLPGMIFSTEIFYA
jgi:hypothetical protein